MKPNERPNKVVPSPSISFQLHASVQIRPLSYLRSFVAFGRRRMTCDWACLARLWRWILVADVHHFCCVRRTCHRDP